MKLLVDFGREMGLPLRWVYMGRHFGWTTDRAKAETMKGNGARVEFVPTLAKDKDARKFDGYEISFPVGAERSPGELG